MMTSICREGGDCRSSARSIESRDHDGETIEGLDHVDEIGALGEFDEVKEGLSCNTCLN